MFSWCAGLVMFYCLACVECGYIDISEDYAVNDIQNDIGGKENMTISIPSKLDATRRSDLQRAIDAQDALIPLLIATVLKVYAVIPIALGTLGMILGFGVATSKISLLLAAAIAYYIYLRDKNLFLPLAKDWGHASHELPVFDLHELIPLHYLHEPRIILQRPIPVATGHNDINY